MGLDPELVGKLLQASITGVGLVFAVYAFLLPRAGSILGRRAEVRNQVKKDLLAKLNEGTEEGITDLARRFSELSKFPDILGLLISLPFALYGISSFVTWHWLFYRNWWQGNPLEWLVSTLFGIATVFFIALGFLTIMEVGESLQQFWALLKRKKGLGH